MSFRIHKTFSPLQSSDADSRSTFRNRLARVTKRGRQSVILMLAVRVRTSERFCQTVTDCTSPLTAPDRCVPSDRTLRRRPRSCRVVDDEWLTAEFAVNSSSISTARRAYVAQLWKRLDSATASSTSRHAKLRRINHCQFPCEHWRCSYRLHGGWHELRVYKHHETLYAYL